MTRSRGQFDTRHDDGERRDRGTDDADDPAPWSGVGAFRAWASFHRFEFVLVCWLVVGAILVPTIFGLGGLVLGPDESIPQVVQTFFWTTVVLAIPLLALSLIAHGTVDAFRVLLADGKVASVGRVVVRSLQTASAVAFVLGVKVMLQDTAPTDVEFDPAALLSAFLLIAGFAGMLAFVAADGLVRLVRGTF